jgi:hypothetical protein
MFLYLFKIMKSKRKLKSLFPANPKVIQGGRGRAEPGFWAPWGRIRLEKEKKNHQEVEPELFKNI